MISVVSGSSDRVRRATIAALLVACIALSYAAVEFSFADPALAAWWPAASFASAAGMLARGRERWIAIALVVVVTGVGNVLAGRDVPFALLLGLGNAVEVVIIAALLAPKGRPVRLSTLLQVGRFLWVTLVAAVAAGIALGVVASSFLERPLIDTTLQLIASHASATIVMLPVVLVPTSMFRRVRRREIVLQSVFLAVILAVVFWPGNAWPLTFAPIVAVLWAAFRFPMVVSAAQLPLTGVAVIVLTSLDGGPFAAFEGADRTQAFFVQLFLLVYAGSALITSAARADWFSLASRLRAREEVLREGIVNAEAGIVIGELIDDRLDVVAINDRATRALGGEHPPFGVIALDEMLASKSAGIVTFERDGRTYEASVAERRDPDGPDLLTIVVSEVTEREERERLALESAEQLRRLNAQKDDFISAVSHELRTPVTSILGFSEQLDDPRLPADLAQAGEVIARNARRLADVIDDVLELSQLSALGGPLSAPTPIDLVHLARECARDAEGLGYRRDVAITIEAPEQLIVFSRERELVRVCANLLSNAVKFSFDQATVTVTIAPDDDAAAGGAVIRVIDHGLGIPEAHREMVWERFARAPVDEHRAVPGTGLGLPIVRALVESRLGGSVSLHETAGGGTTVEVRLPTRAPDDPVAIFSEEGAAADSVA